MGGSTVPELERALSAVAEGVFGRGISKCCTVVARVGADSSSSELGLLLRVELEEDDGLLPEITRCEWRCP